MTELTEYDKFYQNIKDILIQARSKAYRAVNVTMVEAYWNIGRAIVEQEQQGKERAEYGKYLIKDLSKRLTQDFGKGFDQSNLRNMRLFFKMFPIRDTLRHELSWSHYRLLSRVKDTKARGFYLNEAVTQNWGTRALERQIHSSYYQRLLASQEKDEVRQEADEKSKPLKARPQDFIKDPYVLEFLDLKPDLRYLEKELEQRQFNI